MRVDRLAINSVSTSGDSLEERLDAYAAAGFKNVEFVLGHVRKASPAATRQALDSRDLKCIGGFDCGLVAFGDATELAVNHRQIVNNARLLADLGGSNLVVGTDGPGTPPTEETIGILAGEFARVAERCEPFGVNLLIEFNWSPVVKSLRTAVDLARRSGAPNVGVLFDPAHYHCTPTKFDQIDSEAVRFIKHVHVNDMRDKPAELSNCNSDRVLPGEGCLDLRALFGRLESLRYDGFYSIEMFSDELWALSPGDASKRMYDSLLTLCD